MRQLEPIDLDLLTADQVAKMLGSTRSTILQIKARIGFTKPVKEVFFRLDDVVRYAVERQYHPPEGMDEVTSRKLTDEFILSIQEKFRKASNENEST